MYLCRENSQKICTDVDNLGLPQMPQIPKLVLCFYFPRSEGWNNHWTEFNKRVKDFHQSMIDFNWRIMEWYFLKSKQLERFGKRTLCIAGTILTGPRITIIYTKPISECDVLSETRKCLPEPLENDIKHLERTGYKLFLMGKIFIFNDERVIAIDYEKENDKTCYKNCLKFNLYHKHEKVNIGESYQRVYGDLKYSFIIGGTGGLLASYLTGYFNASSFVTTRCYSGQNLFWNLLTRFIASAMFYTIIERIMLLKISQPQKYVLSSCAGLISGTFFGICDNCNTDKVIYGATEFGLFSLLCNLFASKQRCRSNRIGNSSKNEISTE